MISHKPLPHRRQRGVYRLEQHHLLHQPRGVGVDAAAGWGPRPGTHQRRRQQPLQVEAGGTGLGGGRDQRCVCQRRGSRRGVV